MPIHKALNFILLFVIVPLSIFSQKKVKEKQFDIYREKVATGYKIYADNNTSFTVSGKVKYKKLKNLMTKDRDTSWYIVPPKTKRMLLTELTVVDPDKPFYMYMKRYGRTGNYYKKDYDKNFEYHLPFAQNSTFYVLQGYNGSFSHNNTNALDFKMPEGTKIYAARGGRVLKTKQDSNVFCKTPACIKQANFIVIYHFDGTIGTYYHLQKNGVVVKPGDLVNIGQHIGYSGNTGFTTEPHLHFQVHSIGDSGKYYTIKTKFLVSKDKTAHYLSSSKRYTNHFKTID